MRLRIHRHHAGRVLAATGLALFGLGLTGPVAADPPGDNGTIKVDGVAFDLHPDNQPHVGCTFQIDFYGYGPEVPVTLSFAVHPPTGDAVIHTQSDVLDDDDASGGGSEAGLDGQFTIDLTTDLVPYEPEPNQGYHVRLDITADDGTPQGSDGKSKVFWVTSCEVPPTSDTTTTAPTTTAPARESTTTNVAPTSEGTVTTAAVLPTNITAPPRQGTEVLGVELARTGMSGTLVVLGLTLLGLGVAVELLAQAAKRRSPAR